MHIKKICSIFIYEKTFCSTVKKKTLWSYLYKNSFGNIKNFSKSETKIAKHVFCRINTKRGIFVSQDNTNYLKL